MPHWLCLRGPPLTFGTPPPTPLPQVWASCYHSWSIAVVNTSHRTGCFRVSIKPPPLSMLCSLIPTTPQIQCEQHSIVTGFSQGDSHSLCNTVVEGHITPPSPAGCSRHPHRPFHTLDPWPATPTTTHNAQLTHNSSPPKKGAAMRDQVLRYGWVYALQGREVLFVRWPRLPCYRHPAPSSSPYPGFNVFARVAANPPWQETGSTPWSHLEQALPTAQCAQ